MKNTISGLIFLSVIWLSSCGGAGKPETGQNVATNPVSSTSQANTNMAENTSSTEGVKVIQLTKAMFLEKVYDYEKNPKEWTFIGDKPCVIDFYADWCGPCRKVAPIMAELADKYNGQITIYKVDTDKEPELAQFFGIRSIPTVFFCPAKGEPQMTQGALPKETFEKVITEVLLPKK